MDYLFRKYTTLEVIDQETGEIIHREVSKAKEADSFLKVMGYSDSDIKVSSKPVETEKESPIKYDEEGFAEEPRIREDNIPEEVEKVITNEDRDDSVDDVDPIFSDVADIEDIADDDDLDDDVKDDTDEVDDAFNFELELDSFDFSEDPDDSETVADDDNVDAVSDDVDVESTEEDFTLDIDEDESLPDYPSDTKVDDGFASRITKLDNLF